MTLQDVAIGQTFRFRGESLVWTKVSASTATDGYNVITTYYLLTAPITLVP